MILKLRHRYLAKLSINIRRDYSLRWQKISPGTLMESGLHQVKSVNKYSESQGTQEMKNLAEERGKEDFPGLCKEES